MAEVEEREPALTGTAKENGDGPSRKKRIWKLSKQKRRQVLQTIVLYLGFFALGMSFSIVGPTLLDLERITNTDTKSVSLVFTSRSVAGLGGSILAGVLIPRIHHWLLLALVVFITTIVNIVVPYIRILPLLCAVFAVGGLAGAFYDAGGNMVLLKVWGKENGPWMQALHCVFGFGALIGPLVAEPFLQDRAPEANVTVAPSTVVPLLNNGSSIVYQDPSGALRVISNSSDVPTLYVRNNDGPVNSSFNAVLNQNGTGLPAEPYQTNITWAYLILGIACLVSGVLLMFIVFCCSEIKLSCLNKLKEKPTDKKDDGNKDRDKKLTLTLIVLLFFFYLTYCILEMNVGNYLTAYAVKELNWSEKAGAKVTSVYWAMFTVGRACGIVFVSYISPTKIIIGDIAIAVLSLGSLMLFAHYHTVVLWICTLVLGFGISTVFATGITWAEMYISVTGGVGAIFMIAGGGGEMVGPVIIGILFEKLGPQVFVYVMFTASCMLVVLFGILMVVARKLGRRHPDPAPDEGTELQDRTPLEERPQAGENSHI